MAPCWNGHREARATSAQNACNNGIMYISTRFIIYMVHAIFIMTLLYYRMHMNQFIYGSCYTNHKINNTSSYLGLAGADPGGWIGWLATPLH